jgi:hypothetical protein
MTFRLHSDDACTSQVGYGIVLPSVPVADGLFSVELDVAHPDLNGQALWLEVEMDGTAIVCQEVLPVPYALSLRPGATIMGEEAGSSILTVENSSTANDSKAIRGYASAASGFTAGVNGRTDSSTAGAKGVWGYSAATSGQTYGVHGESNSASGRGVFGRANATSGATYGIYGETSSTSGRGVYGAATSHSGATFGVYGLSEADEGLGVYGWASSQSGENHGVYGRSDSPNGYGVYGNNTVGGYAGYFDGDVAQSRADDGLVKAGVYGICGQSTHVERSFNNVGGTITISSGGGGVGHCIIDFGFQVSDRFWVATPVVFGLSGRGLTCWSDPNEPSNQLECYRFDPEGAAWNGYIMVLIY